MEKKRKKNAEFSVEEGGDLGTGCSGFSHSLLDDKRAWKEEKTGGFNGSWIEAERTMGFQIPLAGAAAAAAKDHRR